MTTSQRSVKASAATQPYPSSTRPTACSPGKPLDTSQRIYETTSSYNKHYCTENGTTTVDTIWRWATTRNVSQRTPQGWKEAQQRLPTKPHRQHATGCHKRPNTVSTFKNVQTLYLHLNEEQQHETNIQKYCDMIIDAIDQRNHQVRVQRLRKYLEQNNTHHFNNLKSM